MFAWLLQSMAKILEISKTNPNSCTTSNSHRALQSLREHPEHFDKNFFNTTNFSRFQVHFFKFFSHKFNDQSDSDSPINTVLLNLINQGLSLKISKYQKVSDAEKVKKGN